MPRNEQLIRVPVCMDPATLVALRRGRESYETAALPLSYVGRSASIGDALGQLVFVLAERATHPGAAFAQRSNS
jgi:hypothetical protein